MLNLRSGTLHVQMLLFMKHVSRCSCAARSIGAPDAEVVLAACPRIQRLCTSRSLTWRLRSKLYHQIRIACRAWQAVHDRSKEATQRWKEVADHISIEGCLEGIPLIIIAALYLYTLTDPCLFVTCDPATIAIFPSSALTIPSTPALSAADVLAIHRHDPRCSQLPLTSDGWFSLGEGPMNVQHVDRPASGAFERVMEMEIPGALISLHSMLSASQIRWALALMCTTLDARFLLFKSPVWLGFCTSAGVHVTCFAWSFHQRGETHDRIDHSMKPTEFDLAG